MVVVVVIVVVVSIIVSAILYIMLLGFGSANPTPTVQILSKMTVTGGYKVALTNPTATVTWTDVQVQLATTAGTSSWNLKTITWTGTQASANMSASSGVYLVVQDLAGDGHIGSGDSLTFTGVPAGAVMLTLVYTPTGTPMISPATIA